MTKPFDKLVKRILKENVSVRKVDGAYSTLLVVGNQSFHIINQVPRKEAWWFGKELAHALAVLIETRKGVPQ